MPRRVVGDLPIYPSSMNSADWGKVSAAVRNNSFFSACVEDERLLSALQKLVDKAVNDGWSVSSFIDEALQELDRIALDPETIRYEAFHDDFETLYNSERLRLIYLTQLQLSSGYRLFCDAYKPYQLAMYPAWKFHRQPGAKEENKRHDHVQHEGDIRLKTDIAYWLDRNRPEIGGFGNPYGPWGFNSWMRELPVHREEAEKLGLLKPDEKISIPPGLAEWNLPQAMKQVGRQGVSDLSPEQQRNVIARCSQEGITVAQPAENTLQVVPAPDAPDDPLSALDAAVMDAWVTQQVIDMAAQSNISSLELAFDMFITWWIKDLVEEEEEKEEAVTAAGHRLKHPINEKIPLSCEDDCVRV